MFRASICGPLDGGMVTLHTETLYHTLFDWNWILFKKQIAFWATLRWLRGNVRTPYIAHRKARDRLPIRHNWTLFAISYVWDVISGNMSMSALFEGGWVTLGANFKRKGRRPPTTAGVRKVKWFPLHVVSQYPQCIVWFCHKARVWQTDRQTDKMTTANTVLASLLVR